uniref:FAR1 domain-containing protein n=1 Tax=Fagus sylvatica TaxID=28930 RepID=A0A2N9J0E1_FAGSY
MDIGENSVLGDKLNDCKVNQQEGPQEPTHGSPSKSSTQSTHGSPSKSSTQSRHGKKIVEVPKIGMKFDCDDSAYEFYKEYAHQIGFSVRKQFVKRAKTGLVKRRTFCCSKEGERVVDKRREHALFHHPISRVGCLAQVTCQLQKDGMLEIVSFHEQHNHEFAPSPMKHMLRSKKKITLAQQAIADDAEKVGDIKDFHSIEIQSNAQELRGHRYPHLNKIFHEIFTLAAESEMMYEYAKTFSEKLLKDLQEMKKGSYFDSVEGRTKVQGEVTLEDVLQVDTRSESESNEDIPSQTIR